MSTITLDQVRDWLRESAKHDGSETTRRWHANMADAIDAHLAKPAQAADVVAIREVIESLLDEGIDYKAEPELANKLTRAISGEKAGQVDGWPKLQADARIGATVFRNGVSTELVVGRAIREQEWKLACPACGNGTANGQPCACSFEAVTPSTAPDKEGE